MGKKKKDNCYYHRFILFCWISFFYLLLVGFSLFPSFLWLVSWLSFSLQYHVLFFLFSFSCFMFHVSCFFFNSKASRSVCAWDRCVVRRRGRRSSRSSGVVGLMQWRRRRRKVNVVGVPLHCGVVRNIAIQIGRQFRQRFIQRFPVRTVGSGEKF